MLIRILTIILALALLVTPVFAQEGPVPPKASPTAAAATASSVPGLDIPPDQTVNYDEGFVNLQAKCKGPVKWLVVSGIKVKYITVAQTNSIIISVPPQAGAINVFAIGLVDGNMTDYARSVITINGPVPGPAPGPNPGPNPGPAPIPSGKLHVTLLVDMNNVTPELAKLVNSETLRKAITGSGNWFRLYDLKSPIVATKKLDVVAQKVGGSSVMIIQSDDGRVLDARPIPTNENDIIHLVTGK